VIFFSANKDNIISKSPTIKNELIKAILYFFNKFAIISIEKKKELVSKLKDKPLIYEDTHANV
jgi:hypothetical protein